MIILKTLKFIIVLFLFFFVFCSKFKEPRKVKNEEIYISSQPNKGDLIKFLKKYKLKTIINLRGENDGKDWYEDEKKVLKKDNIQFLSLRFSKDKPPPKQELIKFLNNLEKIEYPVLIHCRQGYDRSYFFLNLFMKLKDKNLEIGHIKKARIWGFFNEYENFCIREKITPNSENLKNFIKNIWVPEEFLYELKLENFKDKFLPEENISFSVEVKNKSKKKWIMTSNLKKGIRVGGKIFGPFKSYPENIDNYFYKNEGSGADIFRVGVWDGEINPEETKIFDVNFEAPKEKGKYFVSIDMIDENVNWFYYYGKAPFFYFFEVL